MSTAAEAAADFPIMSPEISSTSSRNERGKHAMISPTDRSSSMRALGSSGTTTPNPLLSPQLSRSAKARRRSSLTVVWPPPRPDSSRSLNSNSYHSVGNLDIVSQAYGSKSSRNLELGSSSYHSRSHDLGSGSYHSRNHDLGSGSYHSRNHDLGSSSYHSRNHDLGSQSYHSRSDSFRHSHFSPQFRKGESAITTPSSCPPATTTKIRRGSLIMEIPGPPSVFSGFSPSPGPPKSSADGNFVSPSGARAKIVEVSPGNVKQKLKTFAAMSPKLPSIGSPGSSPGSLSPGPMKKQVSSKRVKGRWPPVTVKKQTSTRSLTAKAEITPAQVKSRLSKYERLSFSQIGGLPFGEDENGSGNGSESPLKQPTKRSVDVKVKSVLSQFEHRSAPDVLDSPGAYGNADGIVSPSVNRPKMIKRESFLRMDDSERSLGSDGSSLKSPIPLSGGSAGRLPELTFPSGQKLPPPQVKQSRRRVSDRRTNYCIRYEGPTLLRLNDVYGDLANAREDAEQYQEEDASDSPSAARQSRISDSKPAVGSTCQGTTVGELILFFGGKRPDLWITPVKHQRTWMVKRVWDAEDADADEPEHIVEGADLMGNIRGLLGVPGHDSDDVKEFNEEDEEKDDDDNDNHDGDSRADNSRKEFYMKMVYDVGGEIDEIEEEKAYTRAGIAREIDQITKDPSHFWEEEADIDEIAMNRQNMVYKIGEESECSDDDHSFAHKSPRSGSKGESAHNSFSSPEGNVEKYKMVFGTGGILEDESDDETMMKNSGRANPQARMVYGEGGDESDEDERTFQKAPTESSRPSNAKMIYGEGDEFGDSDDEHTFNKMQPTSQRQSNAKMIYGEGDGYDDSDDEHAFNKIQPGSARPSKAKMIYGEGEDNYDSDDERAFNKVQPVSGLPSKAKMIYGEGEDNYDSDDERAFNKVQPVSGASSKAKMIYGDSAIVEDESDDERNFNRVESKSSVSKSADDEERKYSGISEDSNEGENSDYEEQASSDSESASESESENGADRKKSKKGKKNRRQGSLDDDEKERGYQPSNISKGKRRQRNNVDGSNDSLEWQKSGLNGDMCTKKVFKEQAWVISYGTASTKTVEETTETSSEPTSDTEEQDQTPSVPTWKKKVASPIKNEKKSVKLWFMT